MSCVGHTLYRVDDRDEIQRATLATPVLDEAKRVARVEVTRIVLPPGRAVGAHTHPVPVVGYVVDGRIRFQIDRQSEEELAPMAAFYEPANARILHFDNASRSEPATFIAFYLLDVDDREVIRMEQ
jgi:quercetin dioxygenase-like cupin family protein